MGGTERETFWPKILLESQGAAGEKVLLTLPVNFTSAEMYELIHCFCSGIEDEQRLLMCKKCVGFNSNHFVNVVNHLCVS